MRAAATLLAALGAFSLTGCGAPPAAAASTCTSIPAVRVAASFERPATGTGPVVVANNADGTAQTCRYELTSGSDAWVVFLSTFPAPASSLAHLCPDADSSGGSCWEPGSETAARWSRGELVVASLASGSPPGPAAALQDLVLSVAQ